MEEVIKHHGILGMKWGVRRTPQQLGHKPAKEIGDKTKNTSNLSDDELRQKVNRARLEEDYKNLMDKQNQKQVSKVNQLLNGALENFGKQLLTQASNNLAQRIGGNLFKEKTKTFDSKAFEFKDTSRIDTKQLQDAVQWYSLNTKYDAARSAYEKSRK